MESTGIISSYHAVIDAHAIGLDVQTFVLVSLAWQKENAQQQFLDKVRVSMKSLKLTSSPVKLIF